MRRKASTDMLLIVGVVRLPPMESIHPEEQIVPTT